MNFKEEKIKQLTQTQIGEFFLKGDQECDKFLLTEEQAIKKLKSLYANADTKKLGVEKLKLICNKGDCEMNFENNEESSCCFYCKNKYICENVCDKLNCNTTEDEIQKCDELVSN